ncbi:MAG: class I SAM-dependent methyltransferase [Candidatus Heimdallarchaeota archaeon]
MSSHYYSQKPASSGKTTTIQTYQLGNRLSFKSQSGVFGWMKVDKGSELLLNNVDIPIKKGLVLDLGCGYGLIGIALAKAYTKVNFVLADINELAIKLTKENCKTNGVEDNTEVCQGNIYEPVKDLKFSVILTNPPLMAGKKILWEFVSKAKDHLEHKGSIQLVVPKKKGLKSMQKMLESVYDEYEVIAKGSGFWALKANK